MVYNEPVNLKQYNRAYLFFLLALGILTPASIFAYEAAPRASTLQPTFITEKSIQLNGQVNPSEVSDTYQWFEWGVVGGSLVYETRHERVYGGNAQVGTNATIVGLAPSTQYFFRQIAENSRGRDVGITGYVTTKLLPSVTAPLAIVATNEAVFVGEDSAMLRGYVSPHGNTETQVWFEWGVTTNLENQTPHRGFGGNSGPTEVRLERLMPGTLYYFRVVAENSAGRSHGGLRVFITRGTPVVAPTFEAPKDQYAPTASDSSLDETSRNTTTTGDTGTSGGGNGNLPVLQSTLKGPGEFFSMLFGGRKQAGGDEPNEETTDEEVQLASVGASDAAGDFWGMLSGTKAVEVVVEKIGEKNGAAHTPIEYRIAYAYRRDSSATDGKLKIVLPPEVIYIGDNTNNELLIEGGKGPSRTYVLPLGKLEKGKTRSVSILGMVTAAGVAGASGLPDARVRLEYTDAKGTHVIPAESGALLDEGDNTASVGGIKDALLPSSFFGWLAYVLSVIVAIVGIRKLKEYYATKKELLARTETEDHAHSSASYFPGREEITPQGA